MNLLRSERDGRDINIFPNRYTCRYIEADTCETDLLITKSIGFPAGDFPYASDYLTKEVIEDLLNQDGPVDGPPGARGLRGPAGARGPAGLDGVTGPAGFPGPVGEPGERGPKGPPGANGVDGADGAQGPPGERGDTGPRGVQGYRGIRGSPNAAPKCRPLAKLITTGYDVSPDPKWYSRDWPTPNIHTLPTINPTAFSLTYDDDANFVTQIFIRHSNVQTSGNIFLLCRNTSNVVRYTTGNDFTLGSASFLHRQIDTRTTGFMAYNYKGARVHNPLAAADHASFTLTVFPYITPVGVNTGYIYAH